MNNEKAADLKARFPNFYVEAILILPDGWHQIVEDLLAELNTINNEAPVRPEHYGVVDLWIRYWNSTATAFVTPRVDTWEPEQAVACLEAVARFNRETNRTCQLCGNAAVGRVKYMDPVIGKHPRADEILCQEHMQQRQQLERSMSPSSNSTH
ncbi:hypothetical protein HFN60_30470 [Rhizobium leguminosarum]|uniref:hypothetical protein n=1 Tax=Rhizobium leguminosarum TaxID=384 RepID=UPI001C9741EE|nr:hypothetical protein [Rhizobium leguminosarum]MBY5819918.1 hypothetical protein [Rhizobium leguminosarum]